jgi:hypothetical protein
MHQNVTYEALIEIIAWLANGNCTKKLSVVARKSGIAFNFPFGITIPDCIQIQTLIFEVGVLYD